jgi:CheY-like chemotaxis protein
MRRRANTWQRPLASGNFSRHDQEHPNCPAFQSGATSQRKQQRGGNMNNGQTQYGVDPWESIRPHNLRIVIIYETLVDGMLAKRFSDQVIAKVDNGQDLAVNLNVWSSEMLGIPEILNLAGVASATADIVIVSVTDAKSLPRQVKNWIAMWTSLVKDNHPFVAALFKNTVNGNAAVREEMRTVAKREGVHLYSRIDHANGRRHGLDKRPAARLDDSGGTLMPAVEDHVLVVDDDHCSCVLAGKMLQILGYQPDFASNGAEAVESFLPEKYSAILMDVTMPLMDGFDATKAILEIEEEAGGHVPIIAMTANVMPGYCEICLAAGMDDFLAKPFKREELAAKLDWSQRHWHQGISRAAIRSAPIAPPFNREQHQAVNFNKEEK